jgi:biopolymer transport protein ExbB
MLAKIIELWTAKRSARRGLEILAYATSLHEAEKEFGQAKSPLGRRVAAAIGEADRSEGLAAEGIKDRAATLLSRLEAQKARAISREMGILATAHSSGVIAAIFYALARWVG